MARATAILGVLITTAVAAAQPAPPDRDAALARCKQGLDFAAKADLPRAALYLEHCRDVAVDDELASKLSRTRADVARKLDASKLSAMTIVTTPEGMIAETSAMPGERFATPATVWAKAGDYTVNAAADAATLDAGKGLTTTASLEPFSRRTVIINAPTKKQTQPRDGTADFTDEAEEQSTHKGPPPPQKFKSILPDKYKPRGETSDPLLEDPLALRIDGSMAWRLGARVGGGVALRDSSSTAAIAVSLIAARALTGPLSLATRLGWTHRAVDAAVLEFGFGLRLAQTPSLVVTAGAAMRGEVRVQDELAMQEVARVGIGAAAEVELALLNLPVAITLRVEPSFTELTPGTRAHGVMLELGYDFR